jgi:prepilin-type N-terminal cleavage/methylation domain-containing protein
MGSFSPTTTIRRRFEAAQDGFTLVEVLIAAFILVLGSLGVLLTFVAGIHNVQRGKESQVAISVAQREMEKVHSLAYDKVALSSTPAHSTETGKPTFRVNSTTFNLNRTGTAENATMVVESAGSVAPGPTSFSFGGVSGTVYRFVVWRKDAAYCAANPTKTSCTSGHSFKRVVVDVWPDKPPNGSQRAYYELQSDFVDPEPE